MHKRVKIEWRVTKVEVTRNWAVNGFYKDRKGCECTCPKLCIYDLKTKCAAEHAQRSLMVLCPTANMEV